MRLESVTLRNFRNYNGEHQFKLDKDITIIHGDNGFGKSTFFDALEWGLTGKISRLDKMNDGELINKYQFSKEEVQIECSVTIQFNGMKLIRKFTSLNQEKGSTTARITDLDNNILNIDGIQLYGAEKVDDFFSGISKTKNGSRKISKEMFGKYMKQTYILSQDQVKELVLSKNADNMYRSIMNIMGFTPFLRMSDNLRSVSLNFKNKIKEVDVDILKSVAAKSSKKETIIEFNEVNFKEKLSDFSLDFEEENDILQKKLVQEENKLHKQKNFLQSTSDLSEKFNKNFKDLNEVKIRTENIRTLEDKREKNITAYKLLDTMATQKIKKIEIMKRNIKDTNTKISKMKKLRSILSESAPITPDLSNIISQIDLLNKMKIELDYAINNSENYNLYTDLITSFESNKTNLEKKIREVELKEIRRSRLQKRIDQELDKMQDGALINLLSNINEVSNYVKSSYIDTCPVCSSKYEEVELRGRIENNIIELTEDISQTSEYIEKLLGSKNSIKKKLTSTEHKRRELENILRNLTDDYILAGNVLPEISSNRYFNFEFMNKDVYEIEIIKRRLTLQLNELEDLRKTYQEIQILEAEIKALGNFENISEDSIINKIEITKKASTRIKNRINYLSETTRYTELKQLDTQIYQFEKQIEDHLARRSFQEIGNLLQVEIKSINIRLRSISELKQNSELKFYNNRTEDQIKSIETEIIELQDKKDSLANTSDSIDAHLVEISEEFGNTAKDLLNEYDSPIQRYYRYLNPLPTKSSIIFEGEGNHLEVKVKFDDIKLLNNSTSPPNNILSSGQLNTLAISIFLAMNNSQTIHDFNFTAIDDPIQNMDDVNQFSICDVLGSINNQLIFSTHDVEFLKLFIKKNEHKKESIQIYQFKSPFLTNERVEKITF